jgi:hypothetical protein
MLLEYHKKEQYDWASQTLSELEAPNHASCKWLAERGYSSSSLKVNANN